MLRGSLEEGHTISRQIWYQVDADVNAEAHIVDLDTPQHL